MFGLFLFWISQFKDVFTKRLFFIRIFRVLNTVQSFIFKVQFLLFACLFQNSLYILSNSFVFVKHFFILFWSFLTSLLFASQRQLLYHIRCPSICQQLFYFFWSFVLISAPVSGARLIISHYKEIVKCFFYFFRLYIFSRFSRIYNPIGYLRLSYTLRGRWLKSTISFCKTIPLTISLS